MKITTHILNVDHGDSLIIEIEVDQIFYWMVIDCHNPNMKEDSPALAFLKNKKVSRLEFICLSHPDHDHFSGMRQLLKYFSEDGRSVGKFFVSIVDETFYRPIVTSSRIEQELVELYSLVAELVTNRDLSFDVLGENKKIFELSGLAIHSIGPLETNFFQYLKEANRRKFNIDNELPHSSVNKNYLSAILFIETTTSCTLLCGDATSHMISTSLAKFSGQRKKENINTSIDFVKVSHHGSEVNHCEELWTKFAKTGITKAGISAGGSKFSMLPDYKVVNCILNFKLPLYCTNNSGCLNPSLRSKVPKSGRSRKLSQPPPLHGHISFIDNSGTFETITQFQAPIITGVLTPVVKHP